MIVIMIVFVIIIISTVVIVIVFMPFVSAHMRRYEEQIRVLQDDLESEMTLRRRVEHEKQGFQMQVELKYSP